MKEFKGLPASIVKKSSTRRTDQKWTDQKNWYKKNWMPSIFLPLMHRYRIVPGTLYARCHQVASDRRVWPVVAAAGGHLRHSALAGRKTVEVVPRTSAQVKETVSKAYWEIEHEGYRYIWKLWCFLNERNMIFTSAVTQITECYKDAKNFI